MRVARKAFVGDDGRAEFAKGEADVDRVSTAVCVSADKPRISAIGETTNALAHRNIRRLKKGCIALPSTALSQ
jgi:hypothetical protein